MPTNGFSVLNHSKLYTFSRGADFATKNMYMHSSSILLERLQGRGLVHRLLHSRLLQPAEGAGPNLSSEHRPTASLSEFRFGLASLCGFGRHVGKQKRDWSFCSLVGFGCNFSGNQQVMGGFVGQSTRN